MLYRSGNKSVSGEEQDHVNSNYDICALVSMLKGYVSLVLTRVQPSLTEFDGRALLIFIVKMVFAASGPTSPV